jgi:hypothetical protein
VGKKNTAGFAETQQPRLRAIFVICCMEGVFFTLTLKLLFDAVKD